MGYIGIILLMTIESSFLPFPSEIVIIPAAYLAHSGEFNLLLVVLSGVLGSILGALINYYLAMTIGRTVIYRLAETKLAKIFFSSKKNIEKSEKYFLEHGERSTFIGRLVPVVRQLISIPAGLARMNIKKFILYTFLGSLIWNTILAIVGYYFGEYEDKILKYYNEIIVLVFIILSIYVWYRITRRKKENSKVVDDNV